jgi:two-component system, NarL family, sensor kinase
VIHFKTRVILLSVLPILLISLVLTVLSVVNSQRLGNKNIEAFSSKIVELRRDELKNYTQIAMSATKHLYDNPKLDESEAQDSAKTLFRDLHYGDNGYFFVYDYDGKNITHSQMPHLEGQNLWHLRDANGNYLIRSLVRESKSDEGGYTQYVWEKPSLGRQVDKLGFSMGINKWRWMVGTGLYMDDIELAIDSVEDTVDNNTYNIALITVGISLLFTILVTIIAIRFTVSQGQMASQKLQKLSRSSVQNREAERVKLSAVLHNEIAKGIKIAAQRVRHLAQDAESGLDVSGQSAAINALLGKTFNEVMAIANGLHPDILVKNGFYAATEALANQLADKSGIKINVTAIDTLVRPSLTIETTCYRIVQQALENVILHSNATEVTIRIRQSTHLLSVTIQDNGIGFDFYGEDDYLHGKGVGLANMQLQIELLNGHFTLFSSKGTGTMIKIAVPL